MSPLRHLLAAATTAVVAMTLMAMAPTSASAAAPDALRVTCYGGAVSFPAAKPTKPPAHIDTSPLQVATTQPPRDATM